MFSKLFYKSKEPSLLEGKEEKIVTLLEKQELSMTYVIQEIMNLNVTMKDIDKANKILLKKYSKKGLKSYKFPAKSNCEYANEAHSNCICLYMYYRPF